MRTGAAAMTGRVLRGTSGDPVLEMAARYEAYASPQRRAAEDLLALTGREAPRSILEPGCGTGLYSRMLLAAFPGARIHAVDLSAERVRAARLLLPAAGIRFETADAERLPRARYDLITSNATFQWFHDLPRTIARYASMQEKDEILSFSFFGPGTYAELDLALGEALGGGVRVTARRFADGAAVVAALSRSYRRWVVGESRYVEEFPSVKELLRSIKFTGTRGEGCEGPVAWTPRTLARLESVYRERFGCIRATYRVFLCKGTA